MGELMRVDRRDVRAETEVPDQRQYLTFVLEREVFALAITGIREIIEYRGLTSVPMMPDFIRGVINLRGAVVPVIDLASRFGREQTRVHKRSCVVIIEVGLEADRQLLGFMVDAVNEVLDLPDEDVEPPPPFGARIRADFVRGMGKVRGEFVIILDAEQTLSVDEMATITAAAAPRSDTQDGSQEIPLAGG